MASMLLIEYVNKKGIQVKLIIDINSLILLVIYVSGLQKLAPLTVEP